MSRGTTLFAPGLVSSVRFGWRTLLRNAVIIERDDWSVLLNQWEARLVLGLCVIGAVILDLSNVPDARLSLVASLGTLTIGLVLVFILTLLVLRPAALYDYLPPALMASNFLYALTILHNEVYRTFGDSFNLIGVLFASAYFVVDFSFLRRRYAVFLTLVPMAAALLVCGIRMAHNHAQGLNDGTSAVALAASLFLIGAIGTLYLFMSILEKYLLQLAEARRREEEVASRQMVVQENTRIREELARMNRISLVEAMTTSISQQMASPIADARQALETALADFGAHSSAKLVPAIERATAGIQQAGGILQAIRRMTSRRPAETARIDLIELVNSLVNLARTDLEARGIGILFHARNDGPVVAVVRSEEIGQVLMNLFNNSSDALAGPRRTAPVAPRIDVDLHVDGAGWVTLSVTDNGCGIAPDDLGKVCDSFFTTKPTGTGLGLAICREIAQSHQGTLNIQSSPDHGTCVSLAFPAG